MTSAVSAFIGVHLWLYKVFLSLSRNRSIRTGGRPDIVCLAPALRDRQPYSPTGIYYLSFYSRASTPRGVLYPIYGYMKSSIIIR
ncbi:hypothetical protein JXQ31_18795 [candidate division KSB1 bacterium]|nr:hypothetical protein [candidate division KSB1 bacterium]